MNRLFVLFIVCLFSSVSLAQKETETTVVINEEDEKGIVEKVKYAKDLSDHIPLKEVISFSK